MTAQDLPTEMRASDADRDAVVAALSEHFQAGRLTQAELDDRIGRALTARTLGELREPLTDLPATGPEPQIPAASSPSGRPLLSPLWAAPPLVTVLAGLAIAGLLLGLLQHSWGLVWLIVPALVIARRSARSRGASGHAGPTD